MKKPFGRASSAQGNADAVRHELMRAAGAWVPVETVCLETGLARHEVLRAVDQLRAAGGAVYHSTQWETDHLMIGFWPVEEAA